jgi:hypothetical protein
MHVSSSTDHWQDVVAGSLLGFAIANFAYRQYFPSLASKCSDLPYPPRTLHPEDASDLPYYHRNLPDSQRQAEVEPLSSTVGRDSMGRNELEHP